MDLLGASAALSLETSPLLLFAVYFAARARRSARMHQGVAVEWPPARFHVAGSSVREARSHCAFPGTSELSEMFLVQRDEAGDVFPMLLLDFFASGLLVSVSLVLTPALGILTFRLR